MVVTKATQDSNMRHAKLEPAWKYHNTIINFDIQSLVTIYCCQFGSKGQLVHALVAGLHEMWIQNPP